MSTTDRVILRFTSIIMNWVGRRENERNRQSEERAAFMLQRINKLKSTRSCQVVSSAVNVLTTVGAPLLQRLYHTVYIRVLVLMGIYSTNDVCSTHLLEP